MTRIQSLNAQQLALITAGVLVVLALFTQSVLPLLVAMAYVAWWFFASEQPIAAPEAAPNEDAPPSDANIQTSVTIDGLVAASQAINEVTSMQAASAKEQVQVIQIANERLEDFITLTERINDKAREVTKVANQAASMSDSGHAAIGETITSMDDIRVQVDAIGKTIGRLADLTRRIDDIITSVSEIATQSNLLALNASIEAARAGTHGRGFAVVADEVRVLAGQSTQSAEQVRVILGQIQSAMRETIKATQMGVQNVEEGLSRTRTAQEVMLQLSTSVNDSKRAVIEISQVLQQQTSGMEEIAISMERIQRITQQSLDSTRTVEMVSGNLSRLANDLVETRG
jgi:methyl-accepting chemotaxis protein